MVKPRGIPAAAVLVLVTGLFSYGLQFELERGQFNVIALTLGFTAIWVFHTHPNLRGIAYGLYVLSVQLKLYPGILALMLVHDWRDWGNNLRRFLLLLVANVAGFLVLGPGVAVDWMGAVRRHATDPAVWDGNHSIAAFVQKAIRYLAYNGIKGLAQYASLIQGGLILIVVIVHFCDHRAGRPARPHRHESVLASGIYGGSAAHPRHQP